MLFNRNFILLTIGQVITVFGSSMLRFVLALYVLDTTGRADIFATLLAVSMLPIIIVSPLGGAIADRFNRRNLMVLFDGASCLIAVIFAVFLAAGDPSITLIGVVMVLMSIINTVEQPNNQACIPTLVPESELVRANGVITGVGAIAPLAAPVLGSIIYSAFGLDLVVQVSAVAFLLTALLELAIEMPFTKLPQTQHIIPTIIGDLKRGFTYVFRENHYILKVMTLAAGLNLFLVPFVLVGFPYLLKVTMGSSNTMFGIAQTVIEVSTILGALGIGLLGKRMRMNNLSIWLGVVATLIIPMAIAVVPSLLMSGFWTSYLMFIGAAVPILAVITMLNIYAISVIQKETPNEMLGKVMSIVIAVAQCAAPLGQFVFGKLFEVFSDQPYIPVVIVIIFTYLLGAVSHKLLGKETRDLV